MILILNSGSSTIKYGVVDPDNPSSIARGLIERIGEPGHVADHRQALEAVLAAASLDPVGLIAVGHRVVHGGDRFVRPTIVDDNVVATIRELVPLAPLHNPGAIEGIEAARHAFPGVPQVAVFDTAFHAELPAAAATYALDADLARRFGIRRYGFHGISVRFVAERAARMLARPVDELNQIVLHLGNGASATAVRCGRSVDTSMGLTPLEGLIMGTRPGDLDPGIPGYLQRLGGMSEREVDDLLQHNSGLAGLCGDSDMRGVLDRRAAGDDRAALAVDVYCHRIRRYVGAYHAVLGRLDAIVLTGGVGEHSPAIRAECLSGLHGWGIIVDPARNATGPAERIVSPDGSPVAVCVVPANEERAIADDVRAVLAGQDEGPALPGDAALVLPKPGHEAEDNRRTHGVQ